MTTNFTHVIIRVDIFIGPQSSGSGVVFQTICPFWFIFIFLGQSWVAVIRFPATEKIFITVWGLDDKEFYFGLTTLIVQIKLWLGLLTQVDILAWAPPAISRILEGQKTFLKLFDSIFEKELYFRMVPLHWPHHTPAKKVAGFWTHIGMLK